MFGWWSFPVQLLPSLKEAVVVWLVEFPSTTVTKSKGGCSCLVGGVSLYNCYQV